MSTVVDMSEKATNFTEKEEQENGEKKENSEKQEKAENSVVFTARVSKFTKERIHIEIPRSQKSNFTIGQIYIISCKSVE